MMAKVLTITLPVLLYFSSLMTRVRAHGRLIVPPNRGSMWRYGFNNPDDYQDHELNCGGQKHQWEVNDGRCGYCGDPFDMSPRAHEAGGKYANGIIVDTYQEGSSVKFTLDITAPHKGWFEFRLCPVNNPKVGVTQACLDRYLLTFTNGQTKYYLPKVMAKKISVSGRLPAGLTCTQCVLQWKYHTGKDWGCDKPGNTASCCIGCGPQEEFYGCADVAIVRRGGVITRVPTRRPITTTPRKTTKPRTTQRTTTYRSTTRRTTSRPTTRRTTSRPTTRRTTSRPTTRRRTTNRPTFRRTTTLRPTTSRRTFIWQRTTTTKKPIITRTRSPITRYPVTKRTTTSSWWTRPVTRQPTRTTRVYYTKKPTTLKPYYTQKPTTRKPYFTRRPIYTRRPTTRKPQEGKIPTWTWRVVKTTPSSNRYWWRNNKL